MTAMARLTPLLFVLWVGATVSIMVDLQKRIIGGDDCKSNDRQYHVKLISVQGNNRLLCGGSLISDRWILTAAHCWEQGRTIWAVLGVHPGTGQPVQITAQPVIYTDNNNNGVSHDIMLLQLPNPTQIQPVSLPDCQNPPQEGDTVQIAGYGADTAGRKNIRESGESSSLRCADTTVVNCQRLRGLMHLDAPHKLYQHWFCGQRTGVDTCPGDSGGGVVYKGMIYGVHSFTGDWKFACKEASGFMDVCAYIKWINNIIKRP